MHLCFLLCLSVLALWQRFCFLSVGFSIVAKVLLSLLSVGFIIAAKVYTYCKDISSVSEGLFS